MFTLKINIPELQFLEFFLTLMTTKRHKKDPVTPAALPKSAKEVWMTAVNLKPFTINHHQPVDADDSDDMDEEDDVELNCDDEDKDQKGRI